jgi:DNA-binding beta-propeller fold protein YncE
MISKGYKYNWKSFESKVSKITAKSLFIMTPFAGVTTKTISARGRKLMKSRIILLTFAAAWLLVSCAKAATPAPPATPTTAITATIGRVVWAGDHATVQMDLIGTITSGSAPLGEVRGVALDQAGDLYVVDRSNSRVLKFDPSGKFLLQWGSPGTGDGQFNMHGNGAGFVAVDSLGNVYVTDNNHVQKFDNQGKFLIKWGAAGEGDGQFGLALAIAIDQHNNIYVVDIENNVVQKFDGSGRFLLKWGGRGSGEGQLTEPTSVAIDKQGNVLVAEAFTGRLQKFDSNGRFLSQVFLGAVDDLDIGPVAPAVGDQGQIYVGEYAHGRVVEFDSSGKLLAAWGDTGTPDEKMTEAGGLALDKDGSVYVTDAFHNRVLKFRQH